MPSWREDIQSQIVSKLRAELPSGITVTEIGDKAEIDAILNRVPAVLVGAPDTSWEQPYVIEQPRRQNHLVSWPIWIAAKRTSVAPPGFSALAIAENVENILRGWEPTGHNGTPFRLVSERPQEYVYQGLIIAQEWKHWRQGQ